MVKPYGVCLVKRVFLFPIGQHFLREQLVLPAGRKICKLKANPNGEMTNSAQIW